MSTPVRTPVLYLAGPMSNLPANNYPAFHAAAAKLRAYGYTVLNPAENPPSDWQGYMRMSLRQIADADEIVLLEGWENSKGATLEFNIAKGIGLRISFLKNGIGWQTKSPDYPDMGGLTVRAGLVPAAKS